MTTAKKLTRGVQVGDLIKHKAKPLAVDFAGTTVDIVYNPALLTAEYTDSSGNDSRDLVNVLCAIITEWPLEDVDGAIPVGPSHTEAVGHRVHLGVLRVIYDAIVADNTPDFQSARS